MMLKNGIVARSLRNHEVRYYQNLDNQWVGTTRQSATKPLSKNIS